MSDRIRPARSRYAGSSRTERTASRRRSTVNCPTGIDRPTPAHSTRARELAEELAALARRLNDPALELQAQQALTVTALCRGEPAATLRHMEQAAAIYDPRWHRAHSSIFGQDPGVACKAFGAVALWLLGYPDEAVRQSREAVRLSRALAQLREIPGTVATPGLRPASRPRRCRAPIL